MAKGISETDVWQAADALLLEGARPTIERVRLKIGRGSPNTVTPHLDAWFKHLGSRIKDPGAFSAPPELPSPIQQAAQHFWEVALAEARRESDQKLTEGLALAQQSVQQASKRAEEAEKAQIRLQAEMDRTTVAHTAVSKALHNESMAHAATIAHLEAMKDQNAQLSERSLFLEGQVEQARQDAKSATAGGEIRVANAEKRAALDMDRERVARSTAEKRLIAVESKLEKAISTLSVERVDQAAKLAASVALAEHSIRTNDELSRELQLAIGKVEALTKHLEQARAERAAAQKQVSIVEALLERINSTKGSVRPKKPKSAT